MTWPVLDLVKRLINREILEVKNNRWNPKPVTKFTTLPIRDIIHNYKSILLGMLNYYSFVDNRSQLGKIHWILKESLRKTISLRQKINKWKFKQRYTEGTAIKCKSVKGKTGYTSFECPDLTRRPMKFFGSKEFPDPFIALDKKISTVNSFDMSCAVCGSEERIEMHHLKHIRTINLKLSEFDQKMARINRKQIPLCASCHREVHNGKYQGKPLRKL